MKKKIKIIILYILKYLGLFRLMRRRNRRKLCILGYHGISRLDEHCFQPALFVTERLFRHRMARLSALNYPVISLDDAVNGLTDNSLPDNAVVITFDDGWEGTFSRAIPIVQKYNFPITIYIMSSYVEARIPVLDVLLRYVLWKTTTISLDLGPLDRDGLSGTVWLKSPRDRQQLYEKLLGYLEQELFVRSGYHFIRELCRQLDLDWEQLLSDRMFRLVSPEMIIKYAGIAGIDMELHTHHHFFSGASYETCREEIRENQQKLLDWTGKKSWHFCYPSGWYEQKQIGWLKELNIQSAVTVKPRLNGGDANRWDLGRFLDGQNVSDIEFEAELCGMGDLLRKLCG